MREQGRTATGERWVCASLIPVGQLPGDVVWLHGERIRLVRYQVGTDAWFYELVTS